MEEVTEDKIKLSVNEVDEILSNKIAQLKEGKPSAQFNYNKLQAVVCILASAIVSITFLAWILS